MPCNRGHHVLQQVTHHVHRLGIVSIESCRAVLELTKAKCSISEAKGHFTKEQDHWLSVAIQLKADAEAQVQKARQDLIHKQHSGDLQQVISEKLMTPLNSLLEKWDELINSLSQVTFQSAPPSREELAVIIKVFGDSELCFHSNLVHKTHHLVAAHHGHWYTCPNSHIFSIGECGGAMQASWCNECGEAIGGGNHMLLGTNHCADLMENIAAEQGQGQSPWGWGRGA